MIYFDNSATTVPYPEALRTYQEVATKIFGNPSSLHQLGTSATRILEASRKQVAELIGKSADEIFFTSGGTEGDNWVIKGVAFEKEPYGKHIIVSDIEHPAVKESAKWLSEHGFEVSYAPVNESKGLWMLKLLLDYYALTRSWFRLWLLIMKSDQSNLFKPSQISWLMSLPYLSMWMLFRLLERFQYRPI